MHAADQERRRLLKLGLIAAPALALAAWPRGSHHELWSQVGGLQFYGAPDGIHWANGRNASGLFLPLGLAFALTPGSVSPDGAQLAYSALDRRTGSSIWIVPIDLQRGAPVAGSPMPFSHGHTFDVQPRFMRDGRRIAYAARESGVWRERIRAFSA